MNSNLKKIIKEEINIKPQEIVTDQQYNQIGEKDRIFLTESKTFNSNFNISQIKGRNKPKGLWYGLGTSWIDWVRDEMPEWEYNGIEIFDIDLVYSYNEIPWIYGWDVPSGCIWDSSAIVDYKKII